MDNITKAYNNLHIAIVLQAVDDYKWALKVLENQPKADDKKAKAKYKKAQKTKQECEKFFLSRWGQTLTSNNGELIIERCKREFAQAKKRERSEWQKLNG